MPYLLGWCAQLGGYALYNGLVLFAFPLFHVYPMTLIDNYWVNLLTEASYLSHRMICMCLLPVAIASLAALSLSSLRCLNLYFERRWLSSDEVRVQCICVCPYVCMTANLA